MQHNGKEENKEFVLETRKIPNNVTSCLVYKSFFEFFVNTTAFAVFFVYL